MIECKHSETTGQGIRLTHAESLAHFLECIPDEDRLRYWSAMRDDAQKGVACWDADHHRQLEQRQQQINTYLERITRARAILEGST